jgi:plasmid stabilization system protein ParE
LRYAQRFADQIDLPTHFPAAGTPKPAYGLEIRQLVVHPYVLLYRIADGRVLVLRILDGRRQITRRLFSEPK